MTPEDTVIERKIRLIRKHAHELSKLVPSDEGIADAVGLTRELEVSLATTRKRWESLARAEMESIPRDQQKQPRPKAARGAAPIAESKQYRLIPQFKTVRSYNSQAILAKISGGASNLSLLDALRLAIQVDAVRLTWRYTELKGLLAVEEVPLQTEYREVSDLDGVDGPMVGERKVDNGFKRELIEQTS